MPSLTVDLSSTRLSSRFPIPPLTIFAHSSMKEKPMRRMRMETRKRLETMVETPGNSVESHLTANVECAETFPFFPKTPFPDAKKRMLTAETRKWKRQNHHCLMA